MPKLNISATRTMKATAAAIAVLAVMAATACSSAGATSTATPVPTVTPTPELTPERLVLELRAAGFEFGESEDGADGSFSRMYGFLKSLKHDPLDSDDASEKLWTHEFIGPAEAIIGATRVRPDGVGFDIPIDNEGNGFMISGYGPVRNLYIFVEGNVIAAYLGERTELVDAIKQMMGEPFAGTGAPEKWTTEETGDQFSVNFPKFNGIWMEEPTEVRDVTVTELDPSTVPDVRRFRLSYSIFEPHSASCVGPPFFDQVVDGDQVRITYRNRIANTDTLHFVNDCVINYEWEDRRLSIPGLLPSTTYTVLFNGEVVATIESLMTVEG